MSATVDSTSTSSYVGMLLDAILVPTGVAVMFAYNLSFYLRVKYYPLSTVVGVNHLNRRAWVAFIMQVLSPQCSC